ncbi:MAG: transporter substrate-binding domain-containing protein [Phycisphaerales bacterium]|nr:transporter substrate-binding domain-containing protein [Phycisphaerales bacterium]
MHRTTTCGMWLRAYPRAMRRVMACAALLVAVIAAAAPVQGSADPATAAPVERSAGPAATAPVQVASGPAPEQERTLRIGTVTLPPYSWAKAGTEPFGPAVWLAREVARAVGMTPQWKAYDDLDGLYGALRRGEIDVAATGLPIVAPGDEPFLYSQPWDSSGFSIALHLRPHNRVASTLSHIFTGELLVWFGILLGSMAGFGIVVALIERRRNAAQFGGRGGLWDGVWWSIVTMTTVGYGDKVPRTVPGRIVAGVWMIAALVLVTIIAGVLSSALTTSRLAGYMAIERDLRSVRVGIVNQRADVDMARNLGVSPATYDTPQEALEALQAHEIDALLYPTTALHAMVRLSNDPSLTVLHQEIARGFVAFGIADSMPAPLLRQVNAGIVRAIATTEWVIQSRELGDGEDQGP